MIVQLLTEHHLEFLSLKKKAAEARPSLHLSKCHIVGNHIRRLILLYMYVNLKALRCGGTLCKCVRL